MRILGKEIEDDSEQESPDDISKKEFRSNITRMMLRSKRSNVVHETRKIEGKDLMLSISGKLLKVLICYQNHICNQ